VSLSKRPPITEQQNDATIELRRLADIAEGAEWAEEEITAVRAPSFPEFHIHMTKTPTPTPSAHDTEPAPPPGKLSHFRAILNAVPPAWRGPVVIVAILAVAAAVVQGVKLPW
jgi:hypothetical protein